MVQDFLCAIQQFAMTVGDGEYRGHTSNARAQGFRLRCSVSTCGAPKHDVWAEMLTGAELHSMGRNHVIDV